MSSVTMPKTTVESLFGHMDRETRRRIAALIREDAASDIRHAAILARTGKYPKEQVADSVSHLRQKQRQIEAIAEWFENH